MISIDIETLKREYLFANSAAQLYRHFRENTSLQNLAKAEKLEILLEEYNRRTGKDERSIEDVVEAYAILMAVTFYDYKEAIELFKKFDLSKLEWGEELENIYRREARITIYTTEQGRGVVGDFEQIKSETSNTISSSFMPTNKSAKGG